MIKNRKTQTTKAPLLYQQQQPSSISKVVLKDHKNQLHGQGRS